MLKKIYISCMDYLVDFLSIIFNLLPHRKNIILFESNGDFQDSTKVLYDYMTKIGLDKKYDFIWVIRNRENIDNYKKKYKNVKFINLYSKINGFKYLYMMYYCAIAKYTFYTHSFIGVRSNKKQVRFFLTHAAFSIKNTKDRYWSYKNNSYILSTSEFAAFYRCQVYGGGVNKTVILGLPRNDLLAKKDNSIKEKLNIQNYNKVIIWMPTFKHHVSNKRNDFGVQKEEDISILQKDNMKKVNKILKDKNSLLIIKFHPAQNKNYVNEFNDTNILTLSNEQLYDKGIELYSLLALCDGLITDFSSVYFDYLLCDKPIAFELGDVNDYKSGMGFLMDNIDEYMPGEKITDINSFIDYINNVSDDKDLYKKERTSLKNKIHNYQDGKSCERIIDFLNLR